MSDTKLATYSTARLDSTLLDDHNRCSRYGQTGTPCAKIPEASDLGSDGKTNMKDLGLADRHFGDTDP